MNRFLTNQVADILAAMPSGTEFTARDIVGRVRYHHATVVKVAQCLRASPVVEIACQTYPTVWRKC